MAEQALVGDLLSQLEVICAKNDSFTFFAVIWSKRQTFVEAQICQLKGAFFLELLVLKGRDGSRRLFYRLSSGVNVGTARVISRPSSSSSSPSTTTSKTSAASVSASATSSSLVAT